jgi:hypothetical protein
MARTTEKISWNIRLSETKRGDWPIGPGASDPVKGESTDLELVKREAGLKLKYAAQRMGWGSRKALCDPLEAAGFSRTIQTSFIARMNLTFRQCIPGRLARQTWSLASAQQLPHHAEWLRLYCHFARPHESLREPTPGLRGKYGHVHQQWLPG